MAARAEQSPWQEARPQLAFSLQEEELERLQAQLSAAQQAAQASNGREAEARAQAREYGERARKAESLHEEAQTEIAHVRWAMNGC